MWRPAWVFDNYQQLTSLSSRYQLTGNHFQEFLKASQSDRNVLQQKVAYLIGDLIPGNVRTIYNPQTKPLDGANNELVVHCQRYPGWLSACAEGSMRSNAPPTPPAPLVPVPEGTMRFRMAGQATLPSPAAIAPATFVVQAPEEPLQAPDTPLQALAPETPTMVAVPLQLQAPLVEPPPAPAPPAQVPTPEPAVQCPAPGAPVSPPAQLPPTAEPLSLTGPLQLTAQPLEQLPPAQVPASVTPAPSIALPDVQSPVAEAPVLIAPTTLNPPEAQSAPSLQAPIEQIPRPGPAQTGIPAGQPAATPTPVQDPVRRCYVQSSKEKANTPETVANSSVSTKPVNSDCDVSNSNSKKRKSEQSTHAAERQIELGKVSKYDFYQILYLWNNVLVNEGWSFVQAPKQALVNGNRRTF